MKVQFILLLFTLSLLAACESGTQTGESPDFQLGEPVLAGSGCQDSSIYLNAEGTGVVVEFENFNVQAGGSYSRIKRKSCTLAIPLDIPEGYKLALVPGELAGVMDLKSNSSLTVNLKTFLTGQDGISNKVSFSGSKLGPFSIGEVEDLSAVEFSKCGEAVNLRMNMSLLLKSKNKDDASFASIKAFVGSKKEAFSLQWEKCE